MYVSCKYGPPPDPNMPGSQQMIVCVDENGQEWWVPGEDCQVGDWLAYVEAGGTVGPQDPDQVTTDNITSAPDNLTGGPTIAEVFHVHD
jgi:hypothetical protein